MWVLISLIFIFIIALFSAYNADFVKISYLVGMARVRVALVIVLSALVGALVATLASLSRQLQLRREITQLKSKLGKGEAEISPEVKKEG